MKVLIDTNVVIDVVLKNALFEDTSKAILDKAEQKKFSGYISASAVTDIFYISKKKTWKEDCERSYKRVVTYFLPGYGN